MVVAAASASASGTPSACRLRTASAIVSLLPASRPWPPLTSPPLARTGRPPSESPTQSLTSEKRPRDRS